MSFDRVGAGTREAARLAEQRANFATGEPVRCECCLRTIESADEAPRRTERSPTSKTANSGGAQTTTPDDPEEVLAETA
jgi:hypothetical protein